MQDNSAITLSPPNASDVKELTLDHQLHEAEDMVNELKRILVRHEGALAEEGIRHEVETLERWMESYRRGLAAAHKISETGTVWLSNLRDRLKLAAEERQRLEDEGGNPASKEQAEKLEELLKAVRRIEKVLPNMEQLFHPPEPVE